MILHFDPKKASFRVRCAAIIIWGSLWSMGLQSASAVDADDRKPLQKTPVKISADELVGDERSKSAEFIGNVRVIRGEYTLTTDRLMVLFDTIDKSTDEKSGSQSSIREVIAEGRVRIESDELSASADRATYDRQSRKLVLSGENAAVNRSGSWIRGNRITIFVDSEKVIVSGHPENRVHGVFNLPQKN